MPVMLIFVLLAAASGLLTYVLLRQRLDRRDAAVAVHRLAPPAAGKEHVDRSRPRLIEAGGEVWGPLTGRLLDGLGMRAAAAHLLESAALKWGPAGLGRQLRG